MDVRRAASGFVAAALLTALAVPHPLAARAQAAAPTSGPATAAAKNAAIIIPLAEIGRVRSRTPYCAALARARPGIDAAITYQYQVPVLANDLRHFRLDSELTRAHSLNKAQHDLTVMWDLAQAGRAEVKALRDAANAPGVDEQRRKEMLAFANALDGAKARQMLLAKSVARTVAVLAETKIYTVVSNRADERNDNGGFTAQSRDVTATGTVSANSSGAPGTYTDAQADALAQHDRLQQLFSTFDAERFIRDDLDDAAKHATVAMQLGGCNNP